MVLPINYFTAFRPLSAKGWGGGGGGGGGALVLMLNRIIIARDKRLCTGICLLDMSKAFDKVRHERLLQDLFDIGITGTGGLRENSAGRTCSRAHGKYRTDVLFSYALQAHVLL